MLTHGQHTDQLEAWWWSGWNYIEEHGSGFGDETLQRIAENKVFNDDFACKNASPYQRVEMVREFVSGAVKARDHRD